jgi:hypothetical protein
MYPVPVLNYNYRDIDGAFPNKNTREDDEADDLYTRRFFLVDTVRPPSVHSSW